MSKEDSGLQALLDHIKEQRGFDFTGYKRTSLERRIRKRMQAVGINSFAEYTDYLEVHPDEFGELFNTILINVTSFFRDPPVWEYLASDVIPRVLAARPAASRKAELQLRLRQGQALVDWDQVCCHLSIRPDRPGIYYSIARSALHPPACQLSPGLYRTRAFPKSDNAERAESGRGGRGVRFSPFSPCSPRLPSAISAFLGPYLDFGKALSALIAGDIK